MCGWGSFSINWSMGIWYLQGLLTPVVAVIAVYIAWQQLRTNTKKSKLDLFDRRLAIFLEVRRILSSVIPGGDADAENFLRFRTGVAESYFIFGAEMEKYLDEIYRHGIGLASMGRRRRIPKEERGPEYDPKKVADEEAMHLGWLMDQLPIAKEKFKRYLDVSRL